jgi:class 3 adenylate cyclase
VLRRGHVDYLAEHIPGAKLVELAGDDNVWFSGDVDSLVGEIVSFLTGAQVTAPTSERALATIVLTDIVESTARVVEVGDVRWRAMLERFHEVAAAHIESFRGRLVKSTGDGTLATFDGPARAIQFALSMTGAVSDLGLRLRTGVHTGEVELIGDDIGGIAVHIAARVAGVAPPNGVLVSAALPPLVVGSGIQFEDRGD